MPDIDNSSFHANHATPVATDATRQPVAFIRDGEVFASSRDVAAYFDKEHRTVLRAIDDLIAQEPSLPLRSFVQGSYSLPATGTQEHRCFDMTRDGFTLLAMGFTGQKALKWKLAYLAAFNVMEAELRSRSALDPAVLLSDPTAMRGLLLVYAERQIELQGEIEEMRPQVQALERIALSDGSLCITDAAKTLQVQPKSLFAFLRSHHWIYTRQGGASDIAYQEKLAQGLLEHKTTTVTKSDGYEKTVTQVRVTPKGLARLSREFEPVARAA